MGIEINTRSKRSSEAAVTDGVLQKVNPWLILMFIIY